MCLLLMAVLLILCVACSEGATQIEIVSASSNSEPSSSNNESKNETSTTSESTSFDGTEEAAQMLLEEWLIGHPLMEGQLDELQLFDKPEINGKEYYQFNPFYDGVTTYISLLVDPETGELFYLYLGMGADGEVMEELIPIDKWYQEEMGGAPYTPDYSGRIDDSYSPPAIDPELVGGRWRAYDGGMIEFFSDGTISTNIAMILSQTEEPSVINWEAHDNRATFTATRYWQYSYEITKEEYGFILTLSDNKGISQTSIKAVDSGDGLIGRWNNFGVYNYAELYDNGTGVFALEIFQITEIPFMWHSDESTINITQVSQSYYFDYKVTDDILTLYANNGSIIFERIGE